MPKALGLYKSMSRYISPKKIRIHDFSFYFYVTSNDIAHGLNGKPISLRVVIFLTMYKRHEINTK